MFLFHDFNYYYLITFLSLFYTRYFFDQERNLHIMNQKNNKKNISPKLFQNYKQILNIFLFLKIYH